MKEGKRFTLKSPHGKEATVGHVSESWGKAGSSVPTQAGEYKNPHSVLSLKTSYCRTKCW